MFSMRADNAMSRVFCSAMTAGLIVAFLGMADAQEVDAEEQIRKIAVITNPSNTTSQLSKAELGRAFLKKYTFWDNGSRCIPIDQSGTSKIRAAFYQQVLNRDQEALKRHWMQETMTGNARPPVTVENSVTVKKYMERLDGGIGYVWANEVDASVKVVHITDDSRFEVPESETKADEENSSGEAP